MKSLAYACKNDGGLLNKFDATAESIISFKKYDFAKRVFNLMLV